MFQKSITFLIIFIAALSQVTLLPMLFPFGAVPDLALILVIIWTVENGLERSFGRSLILGFFADIFSFWPAGISAISFLSIAYIADVLAKRFLVSSRTWKFMFIVFSVIIGTIAYGLMLTIFSYFTRFLGGSNDFWLIPRIGDLKIFKKVLYNVILAVIIYWPVIKIERFMAIYNHEILSQKKSFKKL